MARYDVPIVFRAVDGVADGVKSVGASIGGVVGVLGKLGAAATAAGALLASLGAGAALAAATGDAIKLETAINQIGVATGATSDEFGKLREAAVDASNRSGIAVDEVAGALQGLARDGFDAQESIAAIGPALDLARISGVSAAEGVNLLGGTLGSFGLAAQDATRVVDLLSAAALRGGTPINDLGRAVQQLGPVAESAGLGIDDTVSALARLAEREIDGTRAARSLREVLDSLNDPASRFSVELDKLGIETRDFNEVLTELGRRGAEAEPALTAFGANTTAALRVLSEDGGAALAQVRQDLSDTAGAASRAVEKLNDDFGVKLTLLAQNVRNAFVDLIDVSPLKDELQGLIDEVQSVAESEAWQRLRNAITDIFDAIGEIGAALFEDASLGDWAEGGATSAERVAFALKELVPLFETVGDIARVVSNGIQTAFQGVRVTLLTIAKGAIQAQRALAELPGVSDETRDRLALLAETIDSQLSEAYSALRTELVDTVAAVVDSVGAENEAIKAAERGAEARVTLSDIQRAGSGAAKELAEATAQAAAAQERLNEASGSGATIRPIPQAEQDYLAAAVAADRLVEAQSALDEINSKTASTLRTNTTPAQQAATAATDEAADSSKEAAAAGDEQAESMNNLTLALFETSEEGLRKYLDANKAAIIGARAFAQAVNRVTAEIKAQEKDAESYLNLLRQQTTETDEITIRVERLRKQYALLSDAKLRELALAEQALAKENEAFALGAARSFRELEAIRAKKDAEIAADNAVAANRQRIAADQPSAPTASAPTASVGASSVINVTVNGLVGADRAEFLRNLARDLLPVFKQLGVQTR